MQNEKKFLAAFIIVCCAVFSHAQWSPDPFCPFPSDHVTRYPYYGNCSVYWECYAGTKYVMECPDGLEFNAPLQECDTPEIADCDPFASTTANPNPPTWTTLSTPSHQPGPDCPYPSEDLIYFPYPGDCTMYWECYEGDAYLYTCPPDLWWHEEVSYCDYPGPYCDNSTSPTTPPYTTSTQGSNLTCDITDEPKFYPYPGDCTKYIECAGGQLYVLQCDDNMWWNPDVDACDFPGPFCNNDNPTTTEGGTTHQCEDDETSYWPDPNDCHSFIECSNGQAYKMDCPSGLYYSESLNECVGADEAECCQTHTCS